MTYQTGTWGKEAQERSHSRNEYFRNYRRLHPSKRQIFRNSLGFSGEVIGLKVLMGSKKIGKPCDLSWNGKLVDVKTAKPTLSNRGTYRWRFSLVVQKEIADLYLLIRKDNDDRVLDIHLIPNFGKKHISFNENTVIKYSRYLLSL
jgi:hypothetical protein